MTGEELLKAAGNLEEYLGSFDGLLGRVENREHFRRFARGQLGPIKRKALQPMALEEGVPPRTLQFFFSRYAWDEEGVRDELQGKVAAQYGGEDGIFIIDETSDAKKGEHTAGVSRQYCGESGKIDNCIVSVHLAYARDGFHALLDGELFLPECWNPNPEDEEIQLKRRRAGIPDGVRHESKPSMALRQLGRAKANGLPGKFVSADENYGGKPWWREAVDLMGFWYVVEVPKSTQGWTQEPKMEVPPWSGRGRRPTRAVPVSQAKTVEALPHDDVGLRLSEPKRFRVHDTEKGPEVWDVKLTPFWEGGENAPPIVQQLLVARNVRTRQIKYFLTQPPEETPLETLVRVAFSRWHVERCFEDAKQQLGLNHAEIRNYRGLHRHFILTAANYLFLQDWLGETRTRPHGEPGGQSRPEAA